MRVLRLPLVLLIGLVGHFAAAADETTPVVAPVPLESRPYRVRLLIAAADSDHGSVAREIDRALERSVGSLWHPETLPLAGLPHVDAAALRRWSESTVREEFVDEEVDFWFAATAHAEGGLQRVAVRAWQPRFDWLSPVHETSFYEPRETPARLVRLCWNLFRPHVVIEHVDQNDVRLRIPAGDLQPADPDFALLKPGDHLTPWILYYDRNKQLQRRQELPWTYVRMETRDGALGTGTALSGLRMPLAGKTRGRIEKVAVLTSSVYPQTRLQLGVQNQPARLLSGYKLELRPKLPEKKPAEGEQKATDEQPAEEVRRVLTNRLGETDLKADSAHPFQWIYVHSGELLLARVPFVVGSVPALRLEVPDDSVRLQVEGELQALQGELINLVAERNTLIAAARAAAKAAQWDRVDLLRKDLDALPGKDVFHEKLGAIRVPAVQAAKARKDRNGELRIARSCNDMAELINRYLDPDRLRVVREELDELRKAVKELVK